MKFVRFMIWFSNGTGEESGGRTGVALNIAFGKVVMIRSGTGIDRSSYFHGKSHLFS